MTNITWKPIQLLCRNGVDGKDDVVSRISCVVIAERNGFSGRSLAEIDVAYDPGDFTEFGALSEDKVVGWVKGVLGRNGVQLVEQDAETLLSASEDLAMAMASRTSERMTPRGLPWN